MTHREEAFLARHAGIPAATEQVLAQLTARSANRAHARRGDLLSVAQVSESTALPADVLSGLWADGGLLRVCEGAGCWRVPGWQVAGDQLLPHLAEVLAAMPAPIAVGTATSFMNTPPPT